MEKSCGAVVFYREGNSRLYLILKHRKGHFDFPKGHVEAGESEEQTALREILEETGLRVTLLNGFRKTISYKYIKNNQASQKEVVFFLAEAHSKDVKISEEHEQFLWLDFSHARRIMTYKNSVEVLEAAEYFLNKMLG
ncbi:MAG: bis(5'-nucleosyl)-tetraphosphatase [Candidatus Woesearchaeota archaeon]